MSAPQDERQQVDTSNVTIDAADNYRAGPWAIGQTGPALWLTHADGRSLRIEDLDDLAAVVAAWANDRGEVSR